MSTHIDFSLLPSNLPSLCIPRVFMNIDENRIRRIFDELNMGEIQRIDVVVTKTTDKGEKFNRVFVHFKRWFANENADMARERLLNGKEIKIIYDDPWFWKVSAYREANNAQARPPNVAKLPTHKKACFQFDSDEEITKSTTIKTHYSNIDETKTRNENENRRMPRNENENRMSRNENENDNRKPGNYNDSRRMSRNENDNRRMPRNENDNRKPGNYNDSRRMPRNENDNRKPRNENDSRKPRNENDSRMSREQVKKVVPRSPSSSPPPRITPNMIVVDVQEQEEDPPINYGNKPMPVNKRKILKKPLKIEEEAEEEKEVKEAEEEKEVTEK
jgi:hypothetical protein